MSITAQHLRFCLDKSKEITEAYKQHVRIGNHNKKSADDLLEVCTEYLEKGVSVVEVTVETGGPTKAACVVYEDHFEIYIRSGLQEEWRRFVLCKELFHLVIDMEDCRDLNLYEHVEAMQSPMLAENQRNGAQMERLAEACAMEFLFPYADRVEILKRPEINYQQIADQYGIPLVFAEAYLSPTAMEFFIAFRIDE
jgi:Zn-dependent peptidase ImmA (M78 family)